MQGDGVPGTQRAAYGNVVCFGHEHLPELATPGQTLGCLSFAWRDRLFCGALLAVDACPHPLCAGHSRDGFLARAAALHPTGHEAK
ncbi:hypothetical protein [Hydrogenophaga sp.]|uniref:hypothetical protein n=1 Tax=Hydrogenophaga sp. TaxID=1904254 RepID=UPI003F6B0318